APSWAGAAAPGLGRAHAAAGSLTWGSAIWNTESRKEPPARLTEVLPSPTSLGPAVSSPYGEPEQLGSPTSRDPIGESTIPFAIPLHPTPKTYRSQSYSVGQLDPDPPGSSFFSGRTRSNQPAGLQHRPSRPSMLSELSHEGTSLDRVREVDDDDESTNGSQQGVPVSASEASVVELLARENALLRQAAATNQLENMRLRTRAATTNTSAAGHVPGHGLAGAGQLMQESVPEESDYAVEELDELHARGGRGSGRRYSEYGASPDSRYAPSAPPENRKLESLKKGHWQSSLGFGGLGEGQQSRRHSFADVPARNGSIGSVAEQAYGVESAGRDGLGRSQAAGSVGRGDPTAAYMSSAGARPLPAENREYALFRMRHTLEEQALEQEHLRARTYAASYFSGLDPAQRSAQAPPTSLHQAYLMQAPYGPAGRAHSPIGHPHGPRHGAAGPQHLGLSQPRQDQLLCVVTFKCCRSEVFYVQEGTGLEVNTGDMVIVEADRGTDLGTVAQVNVSWTHAKYWKEWFAEEHYKWLMLFSRHSDQAENGGGVAHGGLLSSHGGGLGSAVGGMGPQGGQRGMAEPSNGELKPKMIKRLAQNHEIQSLRDKEGNEAKAKRVCQQKVVEHRLQMEVLDAEFQVDWKKLTFYYFADAYINFNSLVTDLFKIYKTRIWMSAINPASFASPSAGLQAPSGIGPGALGVGADGLADHGRKQHDVQQLYGGLGHTRAFQPSFAGPHDGGQDGGPLHLAGLPTPYAYAFQPYGQRQPPSNVAEYGQAPLSQGSDGPTDFRPVDFGGFRQDQPRGPNSHLDGNGDRRSHLTGDEGLTSSFQGLALGPR
ncbi:MAG: hypothetical protein M1832_006337, partial [Thelocarpon impressellum]